MDNVYNNFLPGLSAGLVSAIICNPFDVYRTHIQLSKINNYQKNLKFYSRGLGASVVCIPSFWSIYFISYEKLKQTNNLNISFLNGYIASNISATFTTPLWVIRQKYQINENFNLHSIKTIFNNKGILPFYAGLKTTYLINMSLIIQIPLYEFLKVKTTKFNYLNNIKNNNVQSINPSNFQILLITAFSKTISALVFYPLDTIRTHIRKNNKSIYNTILHLNKNPINYYKGLLIYLFRSIPYHSSTFVTYEFIKNKINK